MGSVRGTISIEATQQEVWHVMVDPKAWETFAPYMKSLDPLEPGPLRLGSSVRVTPRRLPASTWKVTEFEEPRSFTWETSVAPGLGLVAGHEANARARDTEAVLWLATKGVVGAVLSPLIGIVFRRNIRLASRGLKSYCEHRTVAEQPAE